MTHCEVGGPVMAALKNLIFADIDAQQTGFAVGQAVFVLAVLAGAWKCWRLSRRPTASPKCMWSLMLLLLGWSCAGLITAAARWLPGISGVAAWAGLLALGCFLAAVVMAILGLRECAKNKETYQQGRAQAVWTLALTAIVLGFGIIGNTGGAQG